MGFLTRRRNETSKMVCASPSFWTNPLCYLPACCDEGSRQAAGVNEVSGLSIHQKVTYRARVINDPGALLLLTESLKKSTISLTGNDEGIGSFGAGNYKSVRF